MRKKGGSDKPVSTLVEAREAIRGSSAIVDGVRTAYAIWQVDKDEGDRVCKTLGLPIDPTRVFKGGTVKTNADGFATVDLPSYFGALTRDVRYQLTVLGRSFAQAIVWDKVANPLLSKPQN